MRILQFVQKDGLFHRMHPVTKIAFIVVVSVISMFTINIPFLVLVLAVLLLLALAGDILTEITGQFVLIAIMSIIMILIALLTLPEGPVIGSMVPGSVPVVGGNVPVTSGALTFGVIMALRFAVLVMAVHFFVVSTKPRDLIHALERLRVPQDFVLIFVIALRFIPTLQMEGTRIQEAQMARGYNPGTGPGGRLKRFLPVMIPLVSNALARANVLGLTIDLKGYRTRTRTRLREFPFRRLDYAMFFGMVVVTSVYCILFSRQIL